ncbi:unnamed protein product [Cochlearia groenlandica]
MKRAGGIVIREVQTDSQQALPIIENLTGKGKAIVQEEDDDEESPIKDLDQAWIPYSKIGSTSKVPIDIQMNETTEAEPPIQPPTLTVANPDPESPLDRVNIPLSWEELAEDVVEENQGLSAEDVRLLAEVEEELLQTDFLDTDDLLTDDLYTDEQMKAMEEIAMEKDTQQPSMERTISDIIEPIRHGRDPSEVFSPSPLSKRTRARIVEEEEETIHSEHVTLSKKITKKEEEKKKTYLKKKVPKSPRPIGGASRKLKYFKGNASPKKNKNAFQTTTTSERRNNVRANVIIPRSEIGSETGTSTKNKKSKVEKTGAGLAGSQNPPKTPP